MAGFAYLDHAATTPMRPDAVAAMLPFLAEQYANPNGSYRFARAARQALDEARDQVAEVVGCRPGEVVFTGGGTESDNTAIAGAVRAAGGRAVCPAAEHHGVLHVVEHLGGTVVPVDDLGRVRVDALAGALGPDVAVVSVMAVNNEVGTVTDLATVAEQVRRLSPGAVMHTDAVQAPYALDLRTLWPHVDLLALSAHKFGGPKGVGVLAVRDGTTFEPLVMGGGQERDRRSGTQNVAGIVAMATALVATDAERSAETARVGALRDRLVATIVGAVPDARETVPAVDKAPGSAHLMFRDVENESLLYLLDQEGVCASAASACASGAMDPSHVLAAMGIERAWAGGSLRLSLGRTTTEDDVDHAAAAVVTAVTRLRERRPAVPR